MCASNRTFVPGNCIPFGPAVRCHNRNRSAPCGVPAAVAAVPKAESKTAYHPSYEPPSPPPSTTHNSAAGVWAKNSENEVFLPSNTNIRRWPSGVRCHYGVVGKKRDAITGSEGVHPWDASWCVHLCTASQLGRWCLLIVNS